MGVLSARCSVDIGVSTAFPFSLIFSFYSYLSREAAHGAVRTQKQQCS